MSLLMPETLSEIMRHHFTFSENGIAILDPDDIFVYHNQAFSQMFGLEGTSIIGWHADQWLERMYDHRGGVNIEWESLQSWLDYVHGVFRSKPFRRFESDLVDGRWLLISEQIYAPGYLVMHCADITLQKQTEKKLKEAISAIEQLAQTDELTGMPNRRYVLNRLQEEFARARRYRHPFCVAILDLDHFKNINDQYGHARGDEILKHFARFMQSEMRSGDIVGRLGGEEFCILLLETSIDEAQAALSRIAQLLGNEQFEHIAPHFSYSFSAGIATLSEDPQQDADILLANADKALYQAKSAGRNRVMIYQNAPFNHPLLPHETILLDPQGRPIDGEVF